MPAAIGTKDPESSSVFFAVVSSQKLRTQLRQAPEEDEDLYQLPSNARWRAMVDFPIVTAETPDAEVGLRAQELRYAMEFIPMASRFDDASVLDHCVAIQKRQV